ncbi:MAG: CapA family protein [Dysgonamonadaceae bacterium]|nr:CapA family protein [Dysgonamonadaceae bacterium]MDD4728147.1 CapA family protein [Dysgonamonadaceae bacterium]
MMKILLAGDVFMTRRLPEAGYKGMEEIISLIKQHEVRFANFELTVHRREGYPSLFPGGTYAMADPDSLIDLKKYDFNILNVANNHSMDYSHGGLIATNKYLQENGFLFAGTGENLADASAPVYLDCYNGRAALIACTNSFHDSDAAGNQSPSMKGRPGVNPLRHKTVYELTADNLNSLKKISSDIGINDYEDLLIREGFLLPKENFNFGDYEFKEGAANKSNTYPLQKDMDRIIKSVKEAKRQSDCVMVSIHSHGIKNGDKERSPDFIHHFAKSCIDAGANIIIGHGPHIVRGIELYKNGVIFYGLGNFIFENETISHLPADFYEKYGMDITETVGAAIDMRSKNNTIGLSVDQRVWKSFIPSIDFKDGQIEQILLYPIELGYNLPRSRKGKPSLSTEYSIFNDLSRLSVEYGTIISMKNGIGKVEIK